MEEHIEETVRVSKNGDTNWSLTANKFVYFIFGLLEALLAFRFILRLLGASPVSGFVNFIYDLSAVFIWPFEGIFRRAVTTGVETTSVFEPATLIAIIIYAFLSWGVVKIIEIISKIFLV